MTFWGRIGEFFSVKTSTSRPADEEVETLYRAVLERSPQFSEKLTGEHIKALVEAHEEVADEMVSSSGGIDNALVHACQSEGSHGVVVLLVKKGANVNTRLNGLSPLFVAAAQGNQPVVELLVDVGAEVDGRNERHLLRILGRYVDYYNRARLHLSLGKDSPDGRAREAASDGPVRAIPEVGGLHHRYTRRAA